MRKYKYKPSSPIENKLQYDGDVANARAYYFNDAPLNLKYLLEKRFEWMNDYIKNEDSGIEFGSGIGLSKLFIRCRNYKITDYNENEWLDEKKIDALHTPYENESLDFVVASNMIHHISSPLAFFTEMNRILKPNGAVIIQEINASWTMRRILKAMRNKGYDYTIDVFDKNITEANPDSQWSANCAIPNLLFDNQKTFEKNVPFFKIEYTGFSELFLFLTSGGIITHTKYISLPKFLLKLISRIDKILVGISPQIFALQRQIVLRKLP